MPPVFYGISRLCGRHGPMCLLQTVGEPSVLGARTLCPYVPLRAKPKRERVCKQTFGTEGEAAQSGTPPKPCQELSFIFYVYYKVHYIILIFPNKYLIIEKHKI